jgi:hypothetical protein
MTLTTPAAAVAVEGVHTPPERATRTPASRARSLAGCAAFDPNVPALAAAVAGAVV